VKGWEIKKLGEVSDFQGGSQPPKSNFVSEPRAGYIRLLQIRDFKSEKNAVFIPITKSVKTCDADDIMIGRYGASVGQIHRGKAGAYNVALIKTIPNEDLVLKDFFYLYLISPLFQKPLASVAARSAQDGFSKEDISSFPIPLPPLPEQRRIVALLDEAFAGLETLRANAEKNVQNAQELFDSYLNAVLAGDNQWTDMAFDEFCAIDSKLVDPREPTYLDLPHIGAGNMVSRTGEIIDVRTAREEGLISGKFFFDSRMVLYSKIRPYLMKACRPDFDGLCSADVYPLLPKPGIIDRNFLFYLLMTRRFTDYAIEGSARAGMPKVNREHLFAYPCKLPNLKEQRALAKALDSLQDDCTRLKSIFENKLAAIDELKQSILHQAFSGQLTKSAGIAA